MAGIRAPLALRFWAKVDKSNAGGCWVWTAGRTPKGYGTIRRGGNGTPKVLAHRLSYEFAYGPFPVRLMVLHSCDNPPCVNPDHLFLGTGADNAADRDWKGRGTKPPLHRRATHPRAKLTEEQVAEIRASSDPQYVLARRYNIGTSQISAIRNGKSWR